MSVNKENIDHFQLLVSESSSEIYHEGAGWFEPICEAAKASFLADGLPTLAAEEWRYTNLSAVAKSDFNPLDKAKALNLSDIEEFLLAGCDHLVFVDGHHQEQISSVSALAKGVIIAPMSKALTEHAELLQSSIGESINANANVHSDDGKGFIHLNTALFKDGAFVYVPDNTVLEKPLQLVFISSKASNSLNNLRNMLIIKAGAKAEVLETYNCLDDSAYLNNSITEVQLGENSSLSHNRLQAESGNAYHIGGVYSTLSDNSTFKQGNYQFGSQLARVEVHCDLGTASHSELNGLYIGKDKQLLDNHTRLNHRLPHATSQEFYKGILDDKSRGVFQGCIIVAEQAQKN